MKKRLVSLLVVGILSVPLVACSSQSAFARHCNKFERYQVDIEEEIESNPKTMGDAEKQLDSLEKPLQKLSKSAPDELRDEWDLITQNFAVLQDGYGKMNPDKPINNDYEINKLDNRVEFRNALRTFPRELKKIYKYLQQNCPE